jgi:ABC-type glycerol-3-phosphate transport system permease component
MASIGILQAIASASDFLWQTLIINDKIKHTLISGLPLIIRENIWIDTQNLGKPIGLSITSAVIMFIPLLLIFLIGNKYFRKLDLTYKE